MLNLTHLKQITADDSALMNSLLNEFIRTTNDDTARLRTAVDNQESNQVSFFSHRIKGSAAIIGAKELMKLSGELEQAGREDDAQQFQPLMKKICQCYRQVSEEINHYN